jgi:hypothetical protein
MKKILLATQNQNDMTSFLRTWGVFTHPTLRDKVMPLRYPKDMMWVNDWTYFLEVDCVYMHRPGGTPAYDFRVIDRCKQWNIPLWVDLDDDLENITPDNPVYTHYNTPEAKQVIQLAIREATVLSCGGERHYKRLREIRPDVVLIPNAIDDRLLHLKKPFKLSRKVAWRGSESHRSDLIYFASEMQNVIDGRAEVTFFGLNPYHLKRNFKWTPPLNLMEYYIALTHYNACFHLVPLQDTEFNRVKSNLCWSDATLAGSVVMGPNFEEYRRPGVFTYDHDFERVYQNMVSSSDRDLESCHNMSWDWIRDNILVSKVNQKRLEIIRNV